MMPMTADQMEHLRNTAKAVVNEMSRQGSFWEGNVSLVENFLREACSMGYMVAKDEVCSTPWESMMVPLFRDTGRGSRTSFCDTLNAAYGHGWEFVCACGPDSSYALLRRRKAVSDIEAKAKSD